jgi:hypothetical protein
VKTLHWIMELNYRCCFLSGLISVCCNGKI